MTVREAMDIINGALDSLYEFYGYDVLEEIGVAEAVLEKLVQKEESKPENCYAHCPECGEQLNYHDYVQNSICDKIALFEAEGQCPNCHKTYTWEETFELVDIEFDND